MIGVLLHGASEQASCDTGGVYIVFPVALEEDPTVWFPFDAERGLYLLPQPECNALA